MGTQKIENLEVKYLENDKTCMMITSPFELPKMTLWWGLDSSLGSRLAHTEPISVTAPPGQTGPTGPNGIFSMGLAKSKFWR